MRAFGVNDDISYEDTKGFFVRRAKKFNECNPYAVTMYQDNNPELVRQRNKMEIKKLLPLLELDENSRILDIACGIGRWSDAIKEPIAMYCGIDFCEDFIRIAEKNSSYVNRYFEVGKSTEIEKCAKYVGQSGYNKVLMMGCCIYLNDGDVQETFSLISRIASEQAVVCVREPIGINARLTLKEHFSSELRDEYNAIYRTRDELFSLMADSLIKNDFLIKEEGYLFDDVLNNRAETAQYYFVLVR